MNLEQLIDSLKSSPAFMENVTRWETIPARPARLAAFPPEIDARIPAMLRGCGVQALYTHQRQAADAILRGENIVVVTPTASGKTMCYNLPVLNAILKNSDARALYLFPTKALSADQVSELYELIEAMDVDVKTFTYDGDTPAAARRQVRQAGHIVVTNPDMLHSGILPHHTKWVKLFENLQYVVIDEIHAYRGVFGSNLAGGIEGLQGKMQDWLGEMPEGYKVMKKLEMKSIPEYVQNGYKAGQSFGKGITDGAGGLFSGDTSAWTGYDGIDNVGTVDEVGKVKEDVSISDEDLKFMRDVAEMRYTQNIVTLTPTVSMNASISEKVDVNDVIGGIEYQLENEFALAAEGVYN